ncbi:MAG: molecular chaperone DnaJ [Phenylobacterium sp.]|nr:MAG: molecular chaperone DnaJ [Phenylobacterium sp.]
MPGAFQYKPKFVDIRVKPPKADEPEAPPDVFTLKPGERPCDHAGCRRAATARAPKSRDMMNEHYWFCQEHAAEYNRSWNFFAGMSEGEMRAYQKDELFGGGRPTWEMKAGKFSRESAAFNHRFRRGEGYRDPFDLFGRGGAQSQVRPEPEARLLGKLERNALAELDLDVNADGPKIRTRYTELVRRLHPDANGGDRAGEGRLQKVIRAYQALRKAGMV